MKKSTQPASPRDASARQEELATRRERSRFGKMVKFLFTTSIISIAGLALGLLYLRSQALPVVKIVQTSQIYDLHGDLIDTIHSGQNRQVVTLQDISPDAIHATLAIEDHRFYDHFGLDMKGIARAVWVDLKSRSLEQGASTITQQLAWNLYLTHDRTWERKFKEAILAVQLELQYSKDQILERYLNQIYYGLSTYGVEAAAELYYGKHAKDLTLAESAMLQGIPKGPRYFSPLFDMENAKSRQKDVLDAMVRYNYITPDQEAAALKEKLTFRTQQEEQPDEAPYFRDFVKSEAIAKLGISESQFDSGGYKIYTTLDLRAQAIAEKAVRNNLRNADKGLQAALVSIDPRSGYIKAMVGGRDYEENQFNRAVDGKRQPGSSFKPVVYLTALQNGFTPVTRIKSEPTTFTYDDGRNSYTPSNFNDQYFGPIDLRTAISKSDNIYAVTTIMQVGADKVIDTAKKLGITSPLKPLPSLALGTFPVSPLEMASAFSVIANQGVREDPTAILSIEDGNGKVVYRAKPKQEKVAEPEYTYVLTNLMESVFDEGGTGSRVASTIKRPVAGKTGTTDTDAWMVGFTPELATAVWVGYDRNRDVSAVESHLAAPIFADYTEAALEAVPPKLFPIPSGVVTAYIDPATDKLASSKSAHSRMEVFIKGTEPTSTSEPKDEQDEKKDNPDTPDKVNRGWWQDLKRWWND
ncbi:MAG: carboxypeptidase [Paenibacillaceae bacterium]|jgi:1A family penicillin-binding protein|nr:carboxypeptidase [Paenibacillaceae bacterium]